MVWSTEQILRKNANRMIDALGRRPKKFQPGQSEYLRLIRNQRIERKTNQHDLRVMVRGAYDLQKLRIQMETGSSAI